MQQCERSIKDSILFQKKISNSNNSDGTTITVLSHCTALHISACFQLAVKVLRKGKISTTKPLLCCCNQSAEFRVIRHGLVSLAKYLLPAASNCTLEVLQPNVVGESETTKPTTRSRIFQKPEFFRSDPLFDVYKLVVVFGRQSRLRGKEEFVFQF